MKQLLFILLLIHSINAFAQTYSISNWFNNKQSATVITVDDWDPSSPEVSLPIMISKEVPGTYFVTINNAWRSTDYATMTDAATHGIEIANHTISHPYLSSSGNYADEIANCKTLIDNNVTQDLPVHTLAYPYGDYDITVINEVKKQHVGARSVEYTNNQWGYNYPTLNNEYFTIPTIQAGTMGTINDFIDELDLAIEGGGLYTIMYHSVGGRGWFDDIPELLFNEQLDELKARENSTWLTTFSNAVRYHKEKHCTTLNTISDNALLWTLSITDTLVNNTIFNHPLTITLNTVPGQEYTNVQQGGNDIPFSISVTSLSFNAIPDGGDIAISKGTYTKPPTSNTLDAIANQIEIYPVPTSDMINIRPADNIHIVALSIRNLQGQVVLDQNQAEAQINISTFSPGLYILVLETDNGEQIIKKITKK